MAWYINLSKRSFKDGQKVISPGEEFEVQRDSELMKTQWHGHCLLEMLLKEGFVESIPCIPAPREEWDDDLKARVPEEVLREIESCLPEEAVAYDRWDFM